MSDTDVRCSRNVLFIKPAQRHLYDGQWMTALEISQATGIPRPTINQRLRSGRPVDQLLKGGIKPKLYLFRGEWMTVREIAGLTRLDASTVYDRRCGTRVLEVDELRDPDCERELPSHARLITYRNQTLCHRAWARELGMNYHTFRARLANGWSMERISSEPVGQQERTMLMRNRRIIRKLVSRFRSIRNRILIHRITYAFRPDTGGYAQTSTKTKGTGLGSVVVERDHFTAAKITRKSA